MTTAHPVAFYLRDLSGEPTRRGGRSPFPGVEGASEAELQMADAHARGVLEGRAAAEAAYQEAARRQAVAFEERLAAERQAWSAEQGAELAAQIAGRLDEIERHICERVGHILQPILKAEIRARAVEELARTLNVLLAKGDYGKITISGPQDLVTAIETRLPATHGGVSFVVAEGADVMVSADDTILETRIGAWSRAIDGEDA